MPLETPEADRVRLVHMLEAAQQALLFARSRARADLDTDPMLRRALMHCVQEIGEAASKVSTGGRARALQIPWRKITGMRQRLVHVYFDINLDMLWDAIARDLAPLIKALEQALAVWPAGEKLDEHF